MLSAWIQSSVISALQNLNASVYNTNSSCLQVLVFDDSRYDMKLADAAMLFMKVRYAGKDATRMEVLAMYRYARELRRETLRQQNVLKRMVFTVQQYVL